MAVLFEDDFHYVRIGYCRVGGIERIGSGNHVESWLIDERLGEFVDERGVDEWFVALDIEDVGGLRDGLDCFGEPIGSGRVIRRCHHGLSSKSFHSVRAWRPRPSLTTAIFWR